MITQRKIMKATIKICRAGKFSPGDRDVLRRVSQVLEAHGLSIQVTIKEKRVLTINKKSA